MSISDRIKDALKKARVERDEATRNVIGMLKSKLMLELKSGQGLQESDELWLKVLAAYAKELGKAIEQFEQVGERGQEALAGARFELEFCRGFLPAKLDEAATAALVRRIAAEQGIADPKQAGRLVGAVMKAHKDEVDGALVRKAVDQLLSG